MVTQALENYQIVGDYQVVFADVKRLKAIEQHCFLVYCGAQSLPLDRVLSLDLLIADRYHVNLVFIT